ncbi:hypothetical protein [Roseiterribacter gracilis]|uniref:Uncharacterized protein n=1 Tax=Roseiterribacter gracilis TaxID=2812848 RepID=A0A8S8XI19_9PROT|nr:hypothetical protein TMPK1_30920 [Rhodospirillales bacterium TMPK1]
MSISSVTSSYQVPITAKAQVADEKTESNTVKAKEAETGKDSPAPVAKATPPAASDASTTSVDVKV